MKRPLHITINAPGVTTEQGQQIAEQVREAIRQAYSDEELAETHAEEQFAAHDRAEAVSWAQIVAAYYHALLVADVPPDVAHALTANYQYVNLTRE